MDEWFGKWMEERNSERRTARGLCLCFHYQSNGNIDRHTAVKVTPTRTPWCIFSQGCPFYLLYAPLCLSIKWVLIVFPSLEATLKKITSLSHRAQAWTSRNFVLPRGVLKLISVPCWRKFRCWRGKCNTAFLHRTLKPSLGEAAWWEEGDRDGGWWERCVERWRGRADSGG